MSIFTNDESVKPYQRNYRWVILTAVWFVYFCFGMCMRSVPPIVTPILNDLKMTYGEMGTVLGSWQFVYIPVAIFVGLAIDKFGIRKSLFVGALIMGISEGIRYFVTGYATLLPAVALFGAGGPVISVGAPKVVSLWFKDKGRAVAVGIYTTATWIGGLFGVAATNSLFMPLTGQSWRMTLLIYGLITLTFAITWGIFGRDVKKDETNTGDNVGILQTFVKLFKIRNVRIVLIAGLMSLLSEHGFYQWLPKIFEFENIAPDTAGFLAAIPLAAAIPAVLLIPRFVPSYSRGKFLALIAGVLVTGMLLSFFFDNWLRIAGLVCWGMTAPTLLPLFMLVLMDEPEVGSKYMGMAGGIYFCVAQIGGFAGPLIMGKIVDFTGSFTPGIIIFASVSFVMGLTALTLRLKKPAEPVQIV
ncbi:MAG: MFS transporter [Dehalococcoidales bacterium]|nr:MFS transporter [Dehalococcoidales bacterium]